MGRVTTAKDAHRAIYGTDGHAAGAGSSRLLKNPEVAACVADIELDFQELTVAVPGYGAKSLVSLVRSPISLG